MWIDSSFMRNQARFDTGWSDQSLCESLVVGLVASWTIQGRRDEYGILE